jgi:putative tricarboxylic transport membrane protein
MTTQPALRTPLALAAAALLTLATVPAPAQTWTPNDSVELLVGAGPGGGNDNIARTMQKIITTGRLVPVAMSVVNKPGGGGTIEFSYLQQKKASPYHIAISSNTLLTNYITGKSKLKWSDFAPLGVMINEYIGFVVRKDAPYKTGKALIERLKADPASVVVGISSSLGNINHIAVADVVRAAGIDPRRLKVVVFPSSSASITALLGGHVDLVAGPPSISAKHIEAGTLRALGITSPQRMTVSLAGVPTWREQGYDAVVVNWRGVMGAPGLAPEHAAYWIGVLKKVVASDEWKTQLERNHWENAGLYGEDAAEYMKTQSARLATSLHELGLLK